MWALVTWSRVARGFDSCAISSNAECTSRAMSTGPPDRNAPVEAGARERTQKKLRTSIVRLPRQHCKPRDRLPGKIDERPLVIRWREAVASESGPSSPTTRHVLLTLSLWMNADGKSCSPGQRLLARATGLSQRSISIHTTIADELGWVLRLHGKNSRGWRRDYYEALFPNAPRTAADGIEESRS